MPKGERYLLGCSGYLLWESQAFCLSLLRLQACETFFYLVENLVYAWCETCEPLFVIHASYVSLFLVSFCLLQGEPLPMVLFFFGYLALHMLRGSLSLLVILLSYYVVINTKKGEIESASFPLTGFGINDNIIIYL